jgi:hypothetical protein
VCILITLPLHACHAFTFARARQDVLSNYHPHQVAEIILQRLEAALFLKLEA